MWCTVEDAQRVRPARVTHGPSFSRRTPSHGQVLVRHPRVQPAHHLGLGVIDDQVARHGVASRHVAVAVGRLGAEQVAVAGLLELAAAEALGEHRALVLGDGALDLQQQLVARVLGDGTVEEGDLDAGAAELLEQQHLVGVAARQAVGREHRDDLDRGVARRVAQAVEARAIEPRAAVAVVAEDVRLGQRVAFGLRPAPQARELAVDGLLAFLALGRHSRVDRGTHQVIPPRRWAGGSAGFSSMASPAVSHRGASRRRSTWATRRGPSRDRTAAERIVQAGAERCRGSGMGRASVEVRPETRR